MSQSLIGAVVGSSNVVADDCGAVAGIVAHGDVGRASDNGIFGVVHRYSEGAGSRVTGSVGYRVAFSGSSNRESRTAA